MTIDELKTMKDNECILFVRGMFPFFCNKFKIERHPNYKLLEDFDDKNAYLIGDVNTVKFDQSAEVDDDDLHSEAVDDDTTEHESVPEKTTQDDEQDCHVESVDVGSEQPHSRIAEMQAAAAMMNKIPKLPEDGESEQAKLDGKETVVMAEPIFTKDSDFIGVEDENYLDDYYDEF